MHASARAHVLRERRRQNGADAQPQLRGLRSAVLLRAVARRDVPDLVADHPGQLCLVVDVGENPPGHEDVPAGHGERVDHRTVQDLKVYGMFGWWLAAPRRFPMALRYSVRSASSYWP
jgi:hypothetical protein